MPDAFSHVLLQLCKAGSTDQAPSSIAGPCRITQPADGHRNSGHIDTKDHQSQKSSNDILPKLLRQRASHFVDVLSGLYESNGKRRMQPI